LEVPLFDRMIRKTETASLESEVEQKDESGSISNLSRGSEWSLI